MKENKKDFFNLSTLLFIILFGTFIGSLAASRSGNIELFGHYWVNGGFLPSEGFATAFTQALYSSVLTLFVLMLCGFCAVSQPLILAALLLRGFSIGAGISVTYIEHSTKGIFLTAILIVPFALMSSAVLVLAARESLRSSCILAKFAFKNNSTQFDTKLYRTKFSVLFVLLLISILIQGSLSLLFL
jgi:hypothetical protein